MKQICTPQVYLCKKFKTINKQMERCKWCGRPIQGIGVSDGFISFSGRYCSEKCKEEYRQSKAAKGKSGKSSLIWWIIAAIALAILFMAK